MTNKTQIFILVTVWVGIGFTLWIYGGLREYSFCTAIGAMMGWLFLPIWGFCLLDFLFQVKDE